MQIFLWGPNAAHLHSVSTTVHCFDSELSFSIFICFLWPLLWPFCLLLHSAGVGRTGVFITLSIVLERMRYEGVVDIFQTVKMLRTQRPAMVQTEVRCFFPFAHFHFTWKESTVHKLYWGSNAGTLGLPYKTRGTGSCFTINSMFRLPYKDYNNLLEQN